LRNESLDEIAPVVADSGEGRWTAVEAIEAGVPAPAITAALMNRFSSQGRSDYTRRLLAMMRARFGGHATEKLRPG
jgi:6-phosphogluconate dehydrogenase